MPLKQNYSKQTQKVINIMGKKQQDKQDKMNLIGKMLPEIAKEAPLDLPQTFRLFTHGRGAIVGEEDAFDESKETGLAANYSGTLRCVSQRAKVYCISREHILQLKNQPMRYLMMVKQVLGKDGRRWG